ncbi:tyrosine-type recombinase/integrase (plasmid) [Halolamina sp. CBA1230]|uniref:tyrosine-type recombinase/integrase n=1 Tax=Halolamina sp. CBA1230 TaxID=1853690 RepID=UPI0009A193F5|nr:tyrosine-type recombinase/integrase [Halolamina sp. CBA1230]QKY21842.1 tyrosine-type recombinase/integrase [Halolamina sp. CBA1230]
MPATRDRALTERDFERLVEATYRLDGWRESLEARAVILIGGRLGLRPGELTHLSSEWIDWQREMIRIPAHDPCAKGRDGELCGYCRQVVQQQLADSTANVDELEAQYWRPKTEAGSRDVPFHFSARLGAALEFLDEEHGGWPYSFSTLQRRLLAALEVAPDLSVEATSPHGLRATAASYHAGRGLDMAALRAMFGWEDLETAEQYLNVDGAMTRRALSSTH